MSQLSESSTGGASRRAEDPLVTFYQLYPGGPAPRRADPYLAGFMPARAHHYCEPFTAASGWGWHLFPPIDFELVWDGAIVRWRGAGTSEWSRLDHADLPGLAGLWTLTVPITHVLPRPLYFLVGPHGEPGIVQIWTGLLARTRPGWSLLIRRPVNLPVDRGYEVLEGIVEFDWWFGPVMSNIRMCRTNDPIHFRMQSPLFQAQPIPRQAYAAESLDAIALVEGLSGLSAADWQAYQDAILPRNTPGARPGWYKAEVRRRQNQDRKERPSSTG